MEFLLQLLAELFTNEPEMVNGVTVSEKQNCDVVEIIPVENETAGSVYEESVTEDNILFNFVQFH